MADLQDLQDTHTQKQTEESRTQWQLYRMFQQQQDESLHISYVPPADEVRDTLACPRICGIGPPLGAPVGVVGCRSGESRLPFPPPPAAKELGPGILLVARVRNQQSMGVGLPFMMTGPRYSKLNESSWLIG